MLYRATETASSRRNQDAGEDIVNSSERLRELIKKATLNQDKLERQIYLAAAISSAFEKKGIQSVLVGGAVVEYYTAGEYTTVDIDMVLPP